MHRGVSQQSVVATHLPHSIHHRYRAGMTMGMIMNPIHRTGVSFIEIFDPLGVSDNYWLDLPCVRLFETLSAPYPRFPVDRFDYQVTSLAWSHKAPM
jgi:hypothetical protein